MYGLTINKNFKMETHAQILPEDKLFIELLQKAILKKNFKAEVNTKHNLSLTVADKMEISSKIMAVKQYDDAIMYHILVIISDEETIPDGIEDNLAAFGNTPEDAIQQGVCNFAGTVFPALTGILADNLHNENITIKINNTDVTVHANYGPVRIQGQFPQDYQIYTNSMIELIKDSITLKLQPRKINWLKMYISNNKGDFTGECILNGEYLENELYALKDYALSWPNEGRFLALKQFIIFRVCDKFDGVLK